LKKKIFESKEAWMKQLKKLSRKRPILMILLLVLVCFSMASTMAVCAEKDEEKSTAEEQDRSAVKTGKKTEDKEQKLISITLKETDLREVLNILAFKGGVNIVAGDDVDSKVSVQLKDVPWEKALDVILKTYNYTYKREENLIRVMSLARALEEESKIPLETRILPLNFADVEDLKKSLDKMLSKRGTIEIDERTNSLIITDIPEMVDSIEKSALQLDTLTPQVLIEAMMVDVKISDDNQWGTLMQIIDLKSQNNNSNSINTDFTASLSDVFNFGFTTDSVDVTGVLNMLVEQQLASILANPKVLTLDNQEAMIEITTEIPYEESVDTGGGVTTTIKYKEAGVKLSVTPHVTSGKYISMNVAPEQSFQSGFVEGTTQPIIDKRKAETNLLVKDGQTIVIGGLRQTTDNTTNTKFPFLGDIPFVGLFFRGHLSSKVQTELVLFVTPHIIDTSILTDEEMEMFNKLDNTSKLKFDDRNEIERFRDFFNLKQKAKTIEQQETNRMRIERELEAKPFSIEDDGPVYNFETKDTIIDFEQEPSTYIENDQVQLPEQPKEPDLPSPDPLDVEAAKFRQSMNMLKNEY
jgi:type IV pilus assembly protein PilQ